MTFGTDSSKCAVNIYFSKSICKGDYTQASSAMLLLKP